MGPAGPETWAQLDQLLESDVVGVLVEALPAQGQVVLPKQKNTILWSKYNLEPVPDETVATSCPALLTFCSSKMILRHDDWS